jgi:DNA-binding IclR family transcriptional regulator
LDSLYEKSIQSIERALDILELLAEGDTPFSLSEISSKTGLHRSTVYRIVNVLKKRGYLEKQEFSKKYTLGLAFVEIASHRIDDLDLITIARKYMMQLHGHLVNLASQLCTLDGTQVVYLEEIAGSIQRKHSHMGYKGPAYCSSLGKCLLSGLSGKELNNLYQNYTFESYTSNTIRNFESLKKELQIVRERGWAENNGERNINLASMAACIFDYTGSVIAAVSIGGLIDQFTPEKKNYYLPVLLSTALDISHQLGYMH